MTDFVSSRERRICERVKNWLPFHCFLVSVLYFGVVMSAIKTRYPETRIQSPDWSTVRFLEFPVEIFEEIMIKLSVHEVLRFREVCQKYRTLLTEQLLDVYARRRWGISYDQSEPNIVRYATQFRQNKISRLADLCSRMLSVGSLFCVCISINKAHLGSSKVVVWGMNHAGQLCLGTVSCLAQGLCHASC